MSGSTDRGRGRPTDEVDRRMAILEAARRLFAERGFQGTSMRAIAGAAGVDPALIHHYFGDKAQLLTATLELPFDPLDKIRQVAADGPDGLAERLLSTFLTTWDPHAEIFSVMMRSAVADGVETPMAQFAQNVVTATVAGQLAGPDVPLRANLIVAHVIGIATARYVARLEPLASTPVAEVVAICAPALQHLITPSCDAHTPRRPPNFGHSGTRFTSEQVPE